MGVISIGGNNEFKSASFIYSRVKTFLNSFHAANLIDEGNFPTYTKDVLKLLGIGAYKECQAVVQMENFKGQLPDNFEVLYVAYKCTPFTRDINKGSKKHLQGTSWGFSTEIEKTYIESNKCEIECCCENSCEKEIITIKNYVTEIPEELCFSNLIPLRLSPNMATDACIGDKSNFIRTSQYEIGINDGVLTSNFDNDYIYIKYYGLPISDDGDMLVPNIEQIEQAIFWYIVYQILLSGWYNSSIPDIQNKAQDAENKYNKFFAEAKYINKLPSFAEMVNMIRTKRGLNQLVFFTNQGSNTNFQRSR